MERNTSSSTNTAGPSSSSNTAGPSSSTNFAGPSSSSNTAGPSSSTNTAGPSSSTNTAGPSSSTNTAGPSSSTNAGLFGPSSSSRAGPASSGNYSIAHLSLDAQLMAEFEKSVASGESFHYTKSIQSAQLTPISKEKITGYLSTILTDSQLQSVGCILAVEPHIFRILAYSQNCFEMLGIGGSLLMGTDARNLFTPPSVASLSQAAFSLTSSFQKPISVQAYTNQKIFYATLRKIDAGIIIVFEPAQADRLSVIQAEADRWHLTACAAIMELKSLPRGSVGTLCDTVVKEVQKMTGYDRVMVYKFHEDNHGEVVSEIRRADLEPYLGLHYPGTDIPQASRFLFKKNLVRMICDCNSEPVKIIRGPKIVQPLILANSTLRAPHACHVEYMNNMGSVASLVLAIIVNELDYSTTLWGLVVCHHTAPRHASLPLRDACGYLVYAFSLQLSLELAGAAQQRNLRMHTLLGEMLLRNPPHGIITQSPSIMELVKCDGAALYYKGKSWCIGVTPDESQVKDIVGWLLTTRGESMELSVESLAEAGYPGAATLGNAVCGMAVVRIGSADFMFWFRSHMAKGVKWGGARHRSEDEDDCQKINPRTSFDAFMEVVKNRSSAWEATEIGAIRSLQMLMRNSINVLESSTVLEDQKQLTETSD